MHRDFDPGLMALVVMSLAVFPMIARDLAEPVLGVRYDAEGLSAMEETARRVLAEGFRP